MGARGLGVSVAALASLIAMGWGTGSSQAVTSPSLSPKTVAALPRCDASTLAFQTRGPLFMEGESTRYHQVLKRDAAMQVVVDVLRTCVADSWSVALAVGNAPRAFLQSSPYWNRTEFLGSGPYEAGDSLRFTVHWQWVQGRTRTAPASISINGVDRQLRIWAWSDTGATWSGPTRYSVAPHSGLPGQAGA